MATATKPITPVKILYILLLFLLVLFPFGQLTTIPLQLIGITNIHMYLQDIILLLIWVTLVFYISKNNIRNVPIAKGLVLFIGAATLSLLLNISTLPFDQYILSSLYLVRYIAYLGAFLSTWIVTRKIKYSTGKLYLGLAAVSFLTAVLGLIQYVLYPDLRNLYYLGWDPHYMRVFGTFFDPGFLGLIFVLGINLIYLRILEKRKILSICMMIGIYIALALTYSRSSYIAYAVSISYISIKNRNWKLFLILGIFAVITYILLPQPLHTEGVKLGRTASNQARIGNWQDTLTKIKEAPIFGIGFNTLRYKNKNKSTQYFQNQEIISHSDGGVDNSFLFVWVTTGIIGLLSYIYLLISMYKHGNDLLRVSLVALIVHSFFSNSQFYPWIMLWMWIIVGLHQKHTP